MNWLYIILSFMGGFFAKAGKDYILKGLASITSVASMWGFKSLVQSFPGRAKDIADFVVEQYFMTDPVWASFVAAYMGVMIPGGPSASQLQGKTLAQMCEIIRTQFSRQIMDSMLNLVMPTLTDIERDPKKGAEKYLSVNMKFQMDAWMLHMLGDMQSFGIFKSLKDLPNAISWSFGLGWLSWLVMGTPFKIAISIPLERYFNKQYRLVRMTASQAVQAYNEHLIGEAEMLDRLAEEGYTNREAYLIAELNKTQLSLSQYEELYRRGALLDTQFEYALNRLGYDEYQIENIKYLITSERFFKIKEQISDTVINLYKKGEIDDKLLEEWLYYLNFNKNEINLVKLYANLRRSEEKELSPSTIVEAYFRALITYEQAITMLKNKGYDDYDAKLYIDCQRPIASNSDLCNAYELGIISWKQLIESLEVRGFSHNDALIFALTRIKRELWPPTW